MCLCAACLCLPVPVPIAGLPMPDIISSRVTRPASSSWGDTGIPLRCHPVWYVSVYPLYSVVPTRISGIVFFLSMSFSQEGKFPVKQSLLGSGSLLACQGCGDPPPSVFLFSLPRVPMGPCSLLSYQVNVACGSLFCLSHALLVVWYAWCCILFSVSYASAHRLRSSRVPLLCFPFLSRAPLLIAFPMSMPSATVLVCHVCAAACDPPPFPASLRPPPFLSSFFRVPMVVPCVRSPPPLVSPFCVSSPSLPLVILVPSRSSNPSCLG